MTAFAIVNLIKRCQPLNMQGLKSREKWGAQLEDDPIPYTGASNQVPCRFV